MRLLTQVFVLFILLSSNLLADETGYEIELIIFEDISGRYLNSEDWGNNALKPANLISEDTAITDPEYLQLDWEGAKLDQNLQRLLKNGSYHVLINQRWKQTGLDRKSTFNIPISTKVIDGIYDSRKSYIEGQVKLIMSRYLHFNVDLQYVKPQQSSSNIITLKTYPVKTERRMRSREIHYLDSPMIGIVVLATPYKIQAIEPEINTMPQTYKIL